MEEKETTEKLIKVITDFIKNNGNLFKHSKMIMSGEIFEHNDIQIRISTEKCRQLLLFGWSENIIYLLPQAENNKWLKKLSILLEKNGYNLESSITKMPTLEELWNRKFKMLEMFLEALSQSLH